MAPRLVRSLPELRAVVAGWRRGGERVGVVPTMGALHDGHLSLVRAMEQRADRVIVTLFVNPKQFNSGADLALYPRTEAADAVTLAATRADVLYVPDAETMYPEGFATTVSVAGPSRGLDGAARPGHFDGVAVVVAKLLAQTQADVAAFGEKDFQQLQVVRRLVRDLDMPVEIVGCPTVREADGLAMSSRNLRLPPSHRRVAPRLHAALREASERLHAGEAVDRALATCRDRLAADGFAPVDYVELRASGDLAPLTTMQREPARLLAAAWLGDVRLIDNLPVPGLTPSADALPRGA